MVPRREATWLEQKQQEQRYGWFLTSLCVCVCVCVCVVGSGDCTSGQLRQVWSKQILFLFILVFFPQHYFISHNDCLVNKLKENFWKVFTFRDYAYYLCKSDYGVIWGCEVGGDQIMQDIEAILRNFVLIPRATGRHLRILNRICV